MAHTKKIQKQTGLEETFHYRFRQVKLLETALCHSSFANEHGKVCNERMEFLGDAVLELCVSSYLYQNFPDAREGEMTRLRARLVNETTLASLARRINLGHRLLLGKGEDAQGGREKDSVLSDGLEAVIGAVYLDGGFEAACKVIKRIMADKWPQDLQQQPKPKDAKTRLQEITQHLHGERPHYQLIGSEGPEHDKHYTVKVTLPDGQSLAATGSSLKKAQQQAATQALSLFDTN